jgi:uncharacterized membrane protein
MLWNGCTYCSTQLYLSGATTSFLAFLVSLILSGVERKVKAALGVAEYVFFVLHLDIVVCTSKLRY